MRYAGGGLGHMTTTMHAVEDDITMDIDEDAGVLDEAEDSSARMLAADHVELQQVAGNLGGDYVADNEEDIDQALDSDDEEHDSEDGMDECDDDSDDSSTSDDGSDDDNLGPEDGEDEGYFDMGYGVL